MTNPQVIAIGEALVEIMRPASGQPLDEAGEFCGPFPSGAPAIFAAAAARLELPTAFIGALGQDAFGRLMQNALAAEGINLAGLQFPPGFATGAAFVAYDSTGGREFVFHIRHAAAGQLQAAEIPASLFEGVQWLHVSGSTLALNPNSQRACQRALDLTLAQGGRISLDPNLRLELLPLEEFRQVLAPWIAAADLLLPTVGEARLLSGEQEEAHLARALGAKPGAIVALKRGPAGCTIYREGVRLEIPGFVVEEVDPTGAGDCFSAAFIAGLQAGWSLERVGRFANAAGALAVTKLGPMAGAPTPGQVEELLRSGCQTAG